MMWRLSVPALGHVCQSFQNVPECGGDLCTANCGSWKHWNLLPSLLCWANKEKLFPGVGNHPPVLLVRVWHKPLAEQSMKSNVKQEHGGMVPPVHPAQCCRRSGVCRGTSCIHHKRIQEGTRALLLPPCQDFALHHLLGHSENFVLLVGLSLGFGSRLHF